MSGINHHSRRAPKQAVRISHCLLGQVSLAKLQILVLTHVRLQFAIVVTGEAAMKMIAYLLGILCLIAAGMYLFVQAGSLPTFMPGYDAGSTHIHHMHAVAAVIAAVILFLIGFNAGRAKV
jgi:hypothetical protein